MMATPDDLVHCPICLELYIQPRALPCLHTFCDTCLQEYINAASRNATLAYGFECPICRRHTAPPSPAKNGHSGWSKQFPLNHIVVTLLDARENSSKSANPGDEISASTSTNNSGSSINESTPSCPDTHNGQGTSNQTSTSSSQYFPQESTFHAQKGYDSTSDDYSYEDEDHEYWPIPPPHHLHPHGPPPPPGPHCRPPPPGPHGPPPPFGPPHHPHWPPPHHLRPHHRGRGCHRPNGGPMEGFHPRGPRGRFPHPHGPRHRHHHPPF